jgi:hypothetical protein
MARKRSLKALARRLSPAFALRMRRRMQRRMHEVTSPANVRRQFERRGYLIAQKADYHAPLSSVDDLRATVDRWNRPSALRGIEYDLEGMKRQLVALLDRYLDEFAAIPPYADLSRRGFGPGYTAVDALTLYLIVRHLKPSRFLEVGSGLSTYYCSLAAERNRREGHPVHITCIEPYPYPLLYSVPDITVRQMAVQDVDVATFRTLADRDILFIDSSHVVKIGGDVPFLYLEVLPGLSEGVRVHIHDVPFPYNIPYPPQHWVFGQAWPMLWNEAMMVQALLSGNPDFEIVMSTPLLRHFDEPFLEETVPIYEAIEQNPNTFSSLWLKKAA